MGDGVDDAAVHQRQGVGGEVRRHGQAVAAVAVEHQRCAAVGRRISQPQDRDRYLCAVPRLDEDALHCVELRAVAARHLLGLPEGPLPVEHIEVPDLFRRGGRLVAEPHGSRVELVAFLEAEGISRLLEIDGVADLALVVRDDDAGQGVLPLEANQPVGEGDEVHQVGARPVGQPVLPVVPARVGHRRSDDLEVHGAARVGVQVEVLAMVLRVIDLVVPARRDQNRLGARRRVGGQEAGLAGVHLGGGDEDVLAAQALRDVQEEAVVRFLVDQPVFRRVGAEHVVLHPLRALMVVALDVVEGA